MHQISLKKPRRERGRLMAAKAGPWVFIAPTSVRACYGKINQTEKQAENGKAATQSR